MKPENSVSFSVRPRHFDAAPQTGILVVHGGLIFLEIKRPAEPVILEISGVNFVLEIEAHYNNEVELWEPPTEQ